MLQSAALLFLLGFSLQGNSQTSTQAPLQLDETERQIVPVFIPNAFTPNSDGLNDKFNIIAAQTPHYEMFVFSREGQQVFHSKDANIGWDGNIGTEALRQGYYVWIIRYTGSEYQMVEKTGMVKLIR